MDKLIQYLKVNDQFQDFLKNEKEYYGNDESLILDCFCEYLDYNSVPIFNNIHCYKDLFISFDIIYGCEAIIEEITNIQLYTKQEVLDILENIKKEVENDVK